MNNNRPSFGEFSGYFNICEADYKRIAVGEWKQQVICDQQRIPRLTLSENHAAKDAVADVLLKAGCSSSDLGDCVAWVWPQFSFSIERSQIDRSARVYLSSALLFTIDLAEQLRAVLRSQIPFWRVVIVLPDGDEPDVVIYNDVIRIGDQVGYSVSLFDYMKANWIAAENQSLAIPSTQLAHLNHVLPARFINQQRNVFLLNSFAWSFSPSRSQMAFTVWFGCVGKKRGNPLSQRIQTLQIESQEYTFNTPVFAGLLNSDGRWTLVGTERSKGHCCYFLVPPFSSQTEFTLYGYDDDFREWQLSGKLVNSMQSPAS